MQHGITREMRHLMDNYGFDQLTAWRHERDRAILRDRLAYQGKERTRTYILENMSR